MPNERRETPAFLAPATEPAKRIEMMATLIAIFCLGASCQVAEWDLSPVECETRGAFYAQVWVAEHPGYVLQSTHCMRGRPA